jgi:hypothetical protein
VTPEDIGLAPAKTVHAHAEPYPREQAMRLPRSVALAYTALFTRQAGGAAHQRRTWSSAASTPPPRAHRGSFAYVEPNRLRMLPRLPVRFPSRWGALPRSAPS